MSNVIPIRRRVADPRDPDAMTYEELVNEANNLIEVIDSEDGGTSSEHDRANALLAELQVRRDAE